MPFFEEAKMQQAFLKMGVLGFAGSGKTYTASLVALGLNKMLGNKKPVAFLDTETGSDFMIRQFKKADVKLLVVKQRAFKNLIPICEEAEGSSNILIIDSISAFWNDIMSSYKRKKKAKSGRMIEFITFGDWGVIKDLWRKFTDWYINSQMHCIVCGRAGWEYNEYETDQGEQKLEKLGTKMKAEGEFGFEPSFLVEMERIKVADKNSKIGERVIHRAHVLKDRNDVLDGKSFDNPGFDTFWPTIELLNLGGKHRALDTDTSSDEMFDHDGKPEFQKREEQRQVAYEEITNFISKNFPGGTGQDKIAKLNLCQLLFGTTSGTAIQKKTQEEYVNAYAKAQLILADSENIKLLMSKDPDFGLIKIETETVKE